VSHVDIALLRQQEEEIPFMLSPVSKAVWLIHPGTAGLPVKSVEMT
jgi:hypothetical protein